MKNPRKNIEKNEKGLSFGKVSKHKTTKPALPATATAPVSRGAPATYPSFRRPSAEFGCLSSLLENHMTAVFKRFGVLFFCFCLEMPSKKSFNQTTKNVL